MAYETTVLGLTPDLYWRLNETSGTNAADDTGNSRPGTYSATGCTLGGTSPIVSDSASRSVALNGSTGKVTSSYNPYSASRTFMGWTNHTNHSSTHIMMYSSTGNVALRITTGSSVEWFPNFTGDIATTWTSAWPGDAQWVFWALAHNGTTHLATLYINAVSQTQKATAVYHATPGNVQLSDGLFPGSMTEFAVITGLISAANVTAVYNDGLRLLNGTPVRGRQSVNRAYTY